MPSYLVHATEERARLRHRLFAQGDKKRQAMEILRNVEGIVGIKPGENSILLFLGPEASLGRICEKLELAFPELDMAEKEAGCRACGQKVPASRKGLTSNRGGKLELKVLLGSGAATLALALAGLGHTHALASGLFSIFAIRHVWQRRSRL